MSTRTQPPTDIDVLVVQEVALVEPAHLAVCVSGEEHEHARHPVTSIAPWSIT